jgi:hypothetical protein
MCSAPESSKFYYKANENPKFGLHFYRKKYYNPSLPMTKKLSHKNAIKTDHPPQNFPIIFFRNGKFSGKFSDKFFRKIFNMKFFIADLREPRHSESIGAIKSLSRSGGGGSGLRPAWPTSRCPTPSPPRPKCFCANRLIG